MAGIRKLRKKWYARVMVWDGYHQKEIQIPLKTESKTTARLRLAEVNRYEKDIKSGMNVSFPWQNEDGQVKYRLLSISEIIPKFFASRKTLCLAESTHNRNKHSLNILLTVIGKTKPINRISNSDIETFKDYSINTLDHTPQGTNIDLRLLKTFFRWCKRNGYIENVPDIPLLKIPQALPSYIPEMEWSKLMKSTVLNDIYRKTYIFALRTGCRRSEPYFGKINGHWLLIPAEHTKSKVEREIFLTDELIGIWYEMTNHLQDWLDQGYKFDNYVGKVSKTFLKACRSIGINNRFHDIRHTFAVIRYLQSRDIYQVRKELGHASVTTTEKYAKFNLRRLAQDFPSFKDPAQKTTKTSIMDTDSMDTDSHLLRG